MSQMPSELREKITSADPHERMAAAKALGEHLDPESLKHLIALLSDERPEVVYVAVRSIVSIDSQEAVEETIPLLREEDERLRNLAIEIIGKIGPVGIPRVVELLHERGRDIRKYAVDILKMMRTPETEDPLIQALFDEDPNVAATAAEALSIVGTQRAVPHLIECLKREPWVRCTVLKSLGEIGGEDALKAVLKTRAEEDNTVVFCAVTALGAIGDSKGLDFLMRLLERKDPFFLPSIIQAIERILENADDKAIERVKGKLPTRKIISLLKSRNSGAVRSAIRLLGLLREQTAVEQLVRFYNEYNEHLFQDLEEAFLSIRPDSVEPFVRIIEDEKEPETVKIAAVRLLRGLGSSSTLSPLTACLQTCQGNLKEEIIQTLASLEDRGVLSTLHAILEDEEPRIKEATIEALKRFRDNASISHLVALSTDPSESVRLAAATSLRGYDQKACKEVIVNHLRASDPEAVCFGLDMIPEDLSAKFKRDILPLCNHKDDAVRKRAVEHASFLRDDTAFETVARSLVDDMPQVRLAGIRGLEHCRGREVANLLLKVVGSDPEKWNRYEAVNTIGRLRLLNVIPSLVSLLESAPDLVKTGILDVVGALGNSKYVETIEAYVDAENDEVGRAAAEALERLRVQAT